MIEERIMPISVLTKNIINLLVSLWNHEGHEGHRNYKGKICKHGAGQLPFLCES